MNKKYTYGIIGGVILTMLLFNAVSAFYQADTTNADDVLDYETVTDNTGIVYIDTTDSTGGGTGDAELLTVIPNVGDYINGNYSQVPGGQWLYVVFEPFLKNGTAGSNSYANYEYCWVQLYDGGVLKGWVNMSAVGAGGWQKADDGGDQAILNLTEDWYALGKWVTNGTVVGTGFNITFGEYITVRPILKCNTSHVDITRGYYLAESCTWYVKGWS